MNFQELQKSLPNGLHDAFLNSVSIDYSTKTILLNLSLLTGTPDAPTKAGRETYREAQIQVQDFEYCVMDPPDAKYPYADISPLTIDACAGHPSTSPGKQPEPKDGRFLFWIWVNEWNSFIRISARGFLLYWKP